MNSENSNNSDDVQLDTGVRWIWGAALGLVGASFIEIGMADAGWSVAGVLWALLGVAMVVKAIIMLKEIAKILEPYCDKIVYNGNHYTCYPKGYNRTITFASSSSDTNQHRQVFRDFRKYAGIIIEELLHMD